jgi:hypothetical protein
MLLGSIISSIKRERATSLDGASCTAVEAPPGVTVQTAETPTTPEFESEDGLKESLTPASASTLSVVEIDIWGGFLEAQQQGREGGKGISK